MTERRDLSEEIVAYYERGKERDRLEHGYGLLERERTLMLLRRHLPRPPAVVLDIGGGAGAYAVWLAELGYEVHLRDPLPLHVEQAVAVAHQAGTRFASAAVGDARDLEEFDDHAADAVLLLGPLYHLQESADRRRALEEARRVLLEGGLLAIAAISRHASVLHALRVGLLDDEEHARMLDVVEATGRFDPTPQSGFTKAYFHQPDELRDEVTGSGFTVEDFVGLEGAGVALPEAEVTERWADPSGRAALLEAAERTGRAPEILGISPHMLLLAHR